VACRSDGKTNVDGIHNDTADSQTAPDAQGELSLVLDQSSVQAGNTVGYLVQLTDEDGESTTVTGATLSSDIEPDLDLDGAGLTPALAGDHVLTAQVSLDGVDTTAEAVLEVSPGDLDLLDLTLAEPEVVAGTPLAFTLVAQDAYGNDVDASDLSFAADSAEVTIDEDSVLATLAGSYSLSATAQGQTDTETWTVFAGPAASATLTLDEEDLEAGDTANAEVIITDEYGNPVDADWTLSVEGTGSATVVGDEISFADEGIYTITVTVDGSEVDDWITVTIDTDGPLLTIDNPPRGHWTTETSVLVEGTVIDAVTGITSFTIDSTDVTAGADGSFSERVSLQLGINIVETMATDGDTPESNLTSDIRAVLRADSWASTSAYMSEGLVIRMNEGDGGMGSLSSLAGEMIDPGSISSMMVGEVASGDVWWWDYSINIGSVSLDDIDVTIDTDEPYLRVTAYIYNLDVQGNIGGSFSSDFRLTASEITIEILLSPDVDSAGNITMALHSTAVSVSGMSFDASGGVGVLESIAEFFGVDVVGMIEDELTSAVSTEIASAIPDMVEDALSGIRVSQTMDIGDNSYTIDAIPEAISIDASGMDIALQTQVTPTAIVADAWGVSPPGPGQGGYTYPSFAETSGGTELGLGIDFLNQLMYAVWGGGLLDQAMTDEDLGIDVAVIALVLPGLTDLTLVTTPLLPPVIVPHVDEEAGTELAMQLGDMAVEIYDGPETEESLYMELYVSANIPLTLGMSAAGDAIAIELGTPELFVDVSYPDPSSPAAAGAEAAFELLLPALLPEITGAFGEIPIPAFSGFALTDAEASLVGSDDGYLMISGDLAGE
jgi:hypothetical protein